MEIKDIHTFEPLSTEELNQVFGGFGFSRIRDLIGKYKSLLFPNNQGGDIGNNNDGNTITSQISTDDRLNSITLIGEPRKVKLAI